MIRAIIFACIVSSTFVSVSCQCENSYAGCAGEGDYNPIIFNDAPSPSSEKPTVKKRITVKPKSNGMQATVYMARCEKFMSTHGLDAILHVSTEWRQKCLWMVHEFNMHSLHRKKQGT